MTAYDTLYCPCCGGETNTVNTAGEGQNCRDCTCSAPPPLTPGWLKTLYEPFKFPPCDVCGKGDETRTGDIHGEHLCDDCEFPLPSRLTAGAERKYKQLPYNFAKGGRSVAAA